jgi:type III secretory pathway lipoprotein EscJ
MQTLMLAHQLEKMSMFANALTLLESGDSENAVRLLEQQLSSAISTADDVILADVEINLPPGDLKEGARRANEYVQRHDVSAERKEAPLDFP